MHLFPDASTWSASSVPEADVSAVSMQTGVCTREAGWSSRCTGEHDDELHGSLLKEAFGSEKYVCCLKNFTPQVKECAISDDVHVWVIYCKLL